jgi:deoxyribodipyrimidine photo-lyase
MSNFLCALICRQHPIPARSSILDRAILAVFTAEEWPSATRRLSNMAPKRPTPSKRRLSSNGTSNGLAKRAKTGKASSDPLRAPHPFYQDAEENGIVLRDFYPHEMSNDRARAYNANEIPRPIEVLKNALRDTAEARNDIKVRGAVVHWFKVDLRIHDNTSLHLAAEKAREAGVPLIAMFIISPEDWIAHLTSAVRVDFVLRTLEVLRDDLDKLDIPLHVEVVEDRRHVLDHIFELLRQWDANHLFCNMEYEVDELRREARLVRTGAENGISVNVVHDTCVVPPGRLVSGGGNQFAVYSPWFRAWVRHVHENLDLIELLDPPAKNPPTARKQYAKLFGCKIPAAPASKSLTAEEKGRFHALWPPGEREARKRLDHFIDEKIHNYAASRNLPLSNGTSSVSVHLSSGTLSARTAVRLARDRNKTKKLDGGGEGIQRWISEVAWRDFYKHVLVNWPYVW